MAGAALTAGMQMADTLMEGAALIAPALTAPVVKAALPMDVYRMDRCHAALAEPTSGLKDRRPGPWRIPTTQLAARATFSSIIRRVSARSANFA